MNNSSYHLSVPGGATC